MTIQIFWNGVKAMKNARAGQNTDALSKYGSVLACILGVQATRGAASTHVFVLVPRFEPH